MSRRRLYLLAILVAATIALPFIGKWARSRGAVRCELDGLKIEPRYRVRIIDREGAAHSFCCVHCAERWLARSGATDATVWVTDEASGSEIDAAQAHYVHGDTPTNPITGNRLRVFASGADGEEFIRVFGGQSVPDSERPFANSRAVQP